MSRRGKIEIMLSDRRLMLLKYPRWYLDQTVDIVGTCNASEGRQDMIICLWMDSRKIKIKIKIPTLNNMKTWNFGSYWGIVT